MRHALALFALSLVCLPSHALYKCTAGASTVYSDAPCPAGQPAQLLTPSPAPDAAQAREAARNAARDKAEVNRLRSERERRIAQEDSARARAEAGRLAHQKKCKLLGMKKRWSDEDAAGASIKQEAKAKRSARRKAEQLELECGT
ncbi:DUF4124 domain-containing protein [Lacisediminimonas sp.]|uniref:DUF4124 domain-containing protein n=1 Tax=Lacisediminimonas sp. TaxID=3060582 RepID=UPI00271DED13|nr:DUF4124 domain-containing protein [Lacisediminimonas sp.]MDO8301244.1 DUF4124 domain-containing protein [Lacisediminimonas sp.]MDO9218593.1 DUF4124 domain-containing protein [Lacisediminimonas sp.]